MKTIQITKGDCKRAIASLDSFYDNVCTVCPVARAVRRALQKETGRRPYDLSVYCTSLRIGRRQFDLPAGLLAVREAFDTGMEERVDRDRHLLETVPAEVTLETAFWEQIVKAAKETDNAHQDKTQA